METEEQAKEILQVLRTIYQRQLACDFIIEVTESTVMEFRVHKAMLAAFSRKFRKLLETGQLENDRYQVQGSFISFCYLLRRSLKYYSNYRLSFKAISF